MKPSTIVVSLLLFVSLATSLCAQSPAAAQTPPAAPARPKSWYQDITLAQQARQMKKQPMLVYFFGRRALPCKQMQEQTFPDPEVTALMNQFVLVALDADRNQDVLKQYGVFRVPTIILVGANGKEVDRAAGYKDPQSFARYLSGVLEFQKQGAAAGGYKFGALDILTQRPGTQPVRFRYKNPGAAAVALVGDFNDWRMDATPMRRTPDGEWIVDAYLADGAYEYMYLVNNTDYEPDPVNPIKKANPYGGVNSVVVFGKPLMSPIVQNNRATFVLYDPEAKKVDIAGNFTGWKPIPMYPNRNDPGMWGLSLDLPQNQYAYKYIVDDEWLCDPENYAPVKDAEGHINSSFLVR